MEKEICRNPEGEVGFCNLAVSPDGQLLLIGTKNALWICPTNGGKPRELLKLEHWRDLLKNGKDGFSSRIKWRIVWTPDSRHLLFIKGGQAGPGLWRIAAEGGMPELLDTLPASLGRGDSRSIYYPQELRVHPDGRRIAYVNRQWQQPNHQLRVMKDFLPELSTSPIRLPNPPSGNYFVTQSEDDAEEKIRGKMDLDSSDLDMMHTTSGDQVAVGIRFAKVLISGEAQIQKAYLQFTAEEKLKEPTDLTIHAELSVNAKSFTTADHNISSRKRTKASVRWSPEPWSVFGERSQKQRTPDLSTLIQEVVAQPGWRGGNALVLIITGSGNQDAFSFDGGGRRYAPMLHVKNN